MQKQIFNPALSQNGRPSPSLVRTYRRTTVYSLPVSSIPIALFVFLICIAAWSWTIIHPQLDATLWASAVSSSNDDGNLQGAVDPAKTLSPDADVLATNFAPQVLFWSADILKWAGDYHLDPNIIALVMQIESCGYSQAKSLAGAMGLFQVMPFHFSHEEDPYDPSINATRGLAYLARSLELADGRLDLALAGYNGGHQMIQKSPSLWPKETQRYVYWGVQIYDELGEYDSIPPTLREWLAAGGERLCKQAAVIQAD